MHGNKPSWVKALQLFALPTFLLLVVIVAEFNIGLNDTDRYNKQKSVLTDEAYAIKSSLDDQITQHINSVTALSGITALFPQLTQSQFQALIQKIASPSPSTVEIQLSRGTVITHISELPDRFNSLGFDLSQNPAQTESIEQTIKDKAVRIDGPFPMIGANLNIIVIRAPIFIEDQFYGFAMYLIDFDQLITSLGREHRFALRHASKNGENPAFFGDDALFDQPDNVLIALPLHNQSWQLALEFKPQLSTPIFKVLVYAFELLFFSICAFIIYIAIKFRELSIRDPMTGCHNRRYLKRIYKKRPFKFALSLDIDFFKSINDHFGHDVGDQAIIKFANVLKSTLRPCDHVIRMGGEEFLLMISSGDQQSVLQIAERIRLAVMAIEFREGFSLSASIGVTQRLEDEPLAQLLQRVDLLLYRAKEHGRNRIEHDLKGG